MMVMKMMKKEQYNMQNSGCKQIEEEHWKTDQGGKYMMQE